MVFNRWMMLAAALATLASPPARALIIDNFNNGTLILTGPSFNVVDGAGIVGGERDMTFSFWTGKFASNETGNGLLFLAADTAVNANAGPNYGVRYDGNDNSATSTNFTGLNKVDLTDGGASNAVRVRVAESDTDMFFRITLGEAKAGNQGQLQTMTFADELLTIPSVSAPTDFYLPFANFTNPGCLICVDTSPLDFAQVDYIELDIFHSISSFKVFSLDIIDMALAPVGVPEPATALLLAPALLFFARRRARRENTAVV